MKTIKKSAGLLMPMLFAILSFACAQTSQQQAMGEKLKGMTPAQRAEWQTGMMKSKLRLDSQQTTKVQACNLKYALKFQPIITGDDNRLSKFRKAKALQEEKDTELKGIFTAAQYKQYKDFEDEMRKKIQEKMKK